MNKVAVFGSLNMDILVEVEEFPKVGQTVNAKAIDYKAGGKGVNQAAAAAAVGASTILIGSVGEDNFGQQLIAQINHVVDLDSSRVMNIKDQSTGIASILTNGSDNTIAIVAGANSCTDRKYAEQNRMILEEADVVLVQFETPEDGVEEALKIANNKGAITILNPAPYRSFSKDLLKAVKIIVPNLSEFEDMAKEFGLKDASLEQQIAQWQSENPDTRLIVTRGKDGLSYVESGNVVTLQAIDVKQVDSTGAGDTFCGVLGGLLSKEMPIEEAIYKAAVAAGLSVEHKGALGSAPKMEEIDLYLSKSQEGADNNNF